MLSIDCACVLQIDGAEGTNIHKDIAPLTGEVVVVSGKLLNAESLLVCRGDRAHVVRAAVSHSQTKRRVSALHNTDLGTVLSAHNAKHIVLLGRAAILCCAAALSPI